MKASPAIGWRPIKGWHGNNDFVPAATPELDRQRERRRTLVILLVAGLARLPFLWHGFGGHPDEWYTIRSGLDFWLHGTYYPSRAPLGNPLNEIMMGALAWLAGAPACAIASTFASLVTLAYMRALAPFYAIRDSFWPVLAFSFEPWFWSSGTHCLDYVWGTGSLVAALYYVERRQFAAAGLACAFGFGVRPTSLLWILPVFVRVCFLDRRWQGVLRFALWTAIPALIPALMMVSAIAADPKEALTATGNVTFYVSKAVRYPIVAPLLAFYHLIELMGHIPAVLLIAGACYAARDRLYRLFRSGEGWLWINVAIFVLLFAVFLNHSDKTEYMLPALPGVFLILGRCLSNNWWKAITAAFVFNAFVSFGVGHAPVWGQPIELARPSLRPGALLWYAGRAKGDNDEVSRLGSEMLAPSRIIRSNRDDLTSFYVSALLRRGPASQARVDCPLVEKLLSFPQGRPELGAANALSIYRASHYPILICCDSISALVPHNTPLLREDELKAIVRRSCLGEGDAGTTSMAPKNLIGFEKLSIALTDHRIIAGSIVN